MPSQCEVCDSLATVDGSLPGLVRLLETPTCVKREDAQNLTQTKAGARHPQQININRATVAELKTLPWIGEATAQRIVEYRTKNPPFRRIEELLIIRGISRNRLEQIRQQNSSGLTFAAQSF